MHDCPICGMPCDCDGEDTWWDIAPEYCACDHGYGEYDPGSGTFDHNASDDDADDWFREMMESRDDLTTVE